jgi:hypothetical protein
MIARKRNASYAARIGHTLLLLRTELVIQNGIAILSKKIVHYAEDVIDTFYTKRLSLQFMFVGVSVQPE